MGRPRIVENEYGGILERIDSNRELYKITLEQEVNGETRQAALCGSLEDFLSIDIVPGQEVNGTIVIEESDQPILQNDILAFQVDTQLWREVYFSYDSNKKDTIISNKEHS